MELGGIFPALVTPFRDGRVDSVGLAHNIMRLNNLDLAGFVVLGSTGEYLHVSREERGDIITTVLEHATLSKIIIVGTGSFSTGETIRLTKEAAKLGAHAALVINPFYYRAQMTCAALKLHYSAVADSSEIPIILYNVPALTQINIQIETVAELATHPNIIGIKDSSTDIARLMRISDCTPENFSILTGVAALLYPALLVGAHGAILAMANVLPELCMEIYRFVQRNEYSSARRRQKLLSSVTRVISQYGIGGFSTAMELIGYHGSELRRPLTLPDSTGRQVIRQALEPWAESVS